MARRRPDKTKKFRINILVINLDIEEGIEGIKQEGKDDQAKYDALVIEFCALEQKYETSTRICRKEDQSLEEGHIH